MSYGMPAHRYLSLGAERVDLPATLESLASLGIQKLLVEGGGMIIAEFLRLALVDELTILYRSLDLRRSRCTQPGGWGRLFPDAGTALESCFG